MGPAPASHDLEPWRHPTDSEDFVSKYLTTKVSWRGSYPRIFVLGRNNLMTFNPVDFNKTNCWSFNELKEISVDPEDPTGFSLNIVTVSSSTTNTDSSNVLKLKFKCTYRSHLLVCLVHVYPSKFLSQLKLI